MGDDARPVSAHRRGSGEQLHSHRAGAGGPLLRQQECVVGAPVVEGALAGGLRQLGDGDGAVGGFGAAVEEAGGRIAVDGRGGG